MSKGLEALKENKTLIHTFTSGNALIKYGENETIIEKELKEGNVLKKFLSAICKGQTQEDFEGVTAKDLTDTFKASGIDVSFDDEEFEIIKKIALGEVAL